jgi:cytochrome b6-f complex iron-sulfur subunit
MSSDRPISPASSGTPAGSGRRRFVEFLLGGGLLASAVAFLYPVLRYLVPPRTMNLGPEMVVAAHVGDLKLNSGKIFPFGGLPAILILTKSGRYIAMSAVCTHLHCTVQFRPDLQEIWCPCHNGVYDLQGHNISGPPPRPLQLYTVHVKGNQIFVSRGQNA